MGKFRDFSQGISENRLVNWLPQRVGPVLKNQHRFFFKKSLAGIEEIRENKKKNEMIVPNRVM